MLPAESRRKRRRVIARLRALTSAPPGALAPSRRRSSRASQSATPTPGEPHRDGEEQAPRDPRAGGRQAACQPGGAGVAGTVDHRVDEGLGLVALLAGHHGVEDLPGRSLHGIAGRPPQRLECGQHPEGGPARGEREPGRREGRDEGQGHAEPEAADEASGGQGAGEQRDDVHGQVHPGEEARPCGRVETGRGDQPGGLEVEEGRRQREEEHLQRDGEEVAVAEDERHAAPGASAQRGALLSASRDGPGARPRRSGATSG